MFKSLRREPTLNTTASEPPEQLRRPSFEELLRVLQKLQECFAECKHLAETSRSLSKSIKNMSLSEEEMEADVSASLNELDDFEVPERVMHALRRILDCETRESSLFERLVMETVHSSSKKIREVIPFINRQITAREEKLSNYSKVGDKLAKYERERFTNPKSWMIEGLRKQSAELAAEFVDFERKLVDELGELLVLCRKYFEPVLQAFAGSELNYSGEQIEAVVLVSGDLRTDFEAVKGSEFDVFFDEKMNELSALGVVSCLPTCVRK